MSILEAPALDAILAALPDAVQRELRADEAAGRERRIYRRVRGDEIEWLRRIRLKNGPELSLVDISPGGALIDSRSQLKPGSIVTLELTGAGSVTEVPSAVVRCGIATLNGSTAIYRGACSFVTPMPAESILRPAGPEAAPSAAAWQKIVVRYREGGTLKGYTLDFHPSRGHLSLWPTIHAHRTDRIIVPLARLKALFFVKSFAGDPGHVGPETFESAAPGRRIEVTFFDREIVRGTTLNYRPDGLGFFITPLDDAGNNQRIFVINAAIRYVRFP